MNIDIARLVELTVAALTGYYGMRALLAGLDLLDPPAPPAWFGDYVWTPLVRTIDRAWDRIRRLVWIPYLTDSDRQEN